LAAGAADTRFGVDIYTPVCAHYHSPNGAGGVAGGIFAMNADDDARFADCEFVAVKHSVSSEINIVQNAEIAKDS
jgi:hypothetical protein